MEAKKLSDLEIEEAPRQWAYLPNILAERPNPLLYDIMLARFSNTNSCQWFTHTDGIGPEFSGPVFVVDDETAEDPGNKALDLISEYGGIDGARHKQWLLDELVKVLSGDGYYKWVSEYEDGEDGPKTYSWDVGIAP